jgi:septum formation protein
MQFKRFFYRRFIRPIVTAHDTPHAVALGVAVGILVALTPTIGVQMIVAALIATIVGANRLVAMAMVWLTNPLDAVPLYWFDHFIGVKLLGGQPIQNMETIKKAIEQISLTNFWEVAHILTSEVFWPMLLGGLLFGLVVALPLYPVTLWALMLRQRRIRENLVQVLGKRELVLASSSPRRQELLRQWGYGFRVVEPGVREIIASKRNPIKTARHNARRKALAVAEKVSNPDAIIVAADTLTVLEKKLIGKPADEADAERILAELSGTRHSVITAMCAIDKRTGRTIVDDDEAFVHMRRLAPDEIRDYVKSGEAMGKAGAYAVQETGDKFVRKIDGNFDTVVGFPRDVFEKLMHRLLTRQKAKKTA